MKLKLREYDHQIDFTKDHYTTRESILMKCYDCCNYQALEVKECDDVHCALYPYKEKWYKIPRNRKLSEESSEKYKNIMLDVRTKSSKFRHED
jgi:hypothetical protein